MKTMLTRPRPAAAAFVSALVALAGCTTSGPATRSASFGPPGAIVPQSDMVWMRADGQRASGNPALERQYAEDNAFCEEQVRLNTSVTGAGREAVLRQAAITCMGERGYVLRPKPPG